MYSVIDSIALGPELADHSKHGEPRNSVERVHARTTLPAPHSTRIRLIHMLADFLSAISCGGGCFGSGLGSGVSRMLGRSCCVVSSCYMHGLH